MMHQSQANLTSPSIFASNSKQKRKLCGYVSLDQSVLQIFEIILLLALLNVIPKDLNGCTQYYGRNKQSCERCRTEEKY